MLNKMVNLLERILERATSSKTSATSPPPEISKIEEALFKKKKKKVYLYQDIKAKVDTSPPVYSPHNMKTKLQSWTEKHAMLYIDNMKLVTDIRRMHFTRGKVDSRWRYPLKSSTAAYQSRVNFLKNIRRDNWVIYKLIRTAEPKVKTTAALAKDWAYNRSQIIQNAQGKFVLFPPIPRQDMEDSRFRCPADVQRPRAYMTLQIKDHAPMGTLALELFTDVCPGTCRLFLELMGGDGVGYSYVGTKFFTKVPGYYWRGGDVIYNNGFGCYAQKGRVVPIGAENFHFTHSMPGLLSMSVTKDDEVCGVFNITFKALPQFDMHHVVFGRVIRPSPVYDCISALGSALSSYPEVSIISTKIYEAGIWKQGTSNMNILPMRPTVKDIFNEEEHGRQCIVCLVQNW